MDAIRAAASAGPATGPRWNGELEDGLAVYGNPEEIADAWVAAERSFNLPVLNSILADEFIGIDPCGSLLTKRDWLDRLAQRDLVYERLALEHPVAKEHGGLAVVVAMQTRRSALRGRRVDGRYRMTQVFVRAGDRWRLACMHLKPLD